MIYDQAETAFDLEAALETAVNAAEAEANDAEAIATRAEWAAFDASIAAHAPDAPGRS